MAIREVFHQINIEIKFIRLFHKNYNIEIDNIESNLQTNDKIINKNYILEITKVGHLSYVYRTIDIWNINSKDIFILYR